jgi:hypothetical protein
MCKAPLNNDENDDDDDEDDDDDDDDLSSDSIDIDIENDSRKEQNNNDLGNSENESVQSSNSSVSLSYYYDAAEAHFPECAEPIDNVTYKCKFDGKVCRTKAIMTAYLVRQHKSLLTSKDMESNREIRKTKKSTIVIRKDTSDFHAVNSSNHGVLIDKEIALKIASSDYEDMKKQRGASSSSPSQHERKLKLNTFSDDSLYTKVDKMKHFSNGDTKLDLDSNFSLMEGFKDDDGESFSFVTERNRATYRQSRLEKLLSRTDKIVSRLNNMMATVSISSQNFSHKEIEEKFDNKTLMSPTDKNSHSSMVDAQPMVSNVLENSEESFVVVDDCNQQQPLMLRNVKLRGYQIGGVEWLNSLHMSGLNGILADEM